MKKLFLTLLLGFASCTLHAQDSNKIAMFTPPKLVVGIVVDQMRTDFVYRYWDKYGNGGFKRLINEGYFLKNTHFSYMPTYTGPGHTSIYTGTTPAVHGIIANRWFDRKSNAMLYCTDDLSVHALGGAEKSGQMSPQNMLVTTIGDQLKLSNNQKSKVIGIALKDRGAILPAGHTANAAYWFDFITGNWISSTHYMNQLPAWVNDFNQKALASQYLSKPWTPLLPLSSYTESLSDDNEFEGLFHGETSPVFPHNLPALMPQNDNFELLITTPFGNSLTTDFALQTLQAEQLGKGGVPDLLAISYSSTDYVGHQFGPQSIEVEDTYLRLDQDIARLLNFLDNWLGKDQVLVFLTADHGVVENPTFMNTLKIPAHHVSENEIAQALEKLLMDKFKRKLLLSYSNQQVFLDHDAMSAINLAPFILEDIVAHFMMDMQGVAQTVTRSALTSNYFSDGIYYYIQSGFNQQRSGDIMVNYDPGWIEHEKTGTTHGSGYVYDTHVPLIWYGWKIAPGYSFQATETIDIAPTLSLLLNIQAPNGSTGKFIPNLIKP